MSVRMWRSGISKVVLAAVLAVFVACMGAGAAWADNAGSPLASTTITAAENDPAVPDETADPDPDAETKDGWEQSGTTWIYWASGVQVKGDWVDTAVAPGKTTAGSKVNRYWIDCTGKLAMGRLIDPAKKKDAGANAYYAYATDTGAVATGKKKVVYETTTRVYLAKATGDQIGKLETGNKYGILRTSAYDNGTQRVYYINPSKHCAIVKNDLKQARPVNVKDFGWVLPCYKGGYLLAGAKKKMDTRVYLAKKNGLLESGNVKVKGELTNIVKTKAYDKGTLRYYYINPKTHSAVVKSKAVEAQGFGWVLPCNKGGYLATGRKVIGEKVYLARNNGRLETGDDQGFLTTSSYDANGQEQKYYINPKTHAITYGKPVKVKGFGYVYAPNKNGYLLRGLTKVDSKHILLIDDQGRIANNGGWLVTDAYTGGLERYWLEPTKKNKSVLGARIGYFKVEGKRYRGLDQGYVLRNTYELYKGKYYQVDNGGAFNYNGIVTRLYKKAQGYSSPSRYFIMVDVDNPKTVVFTGHRGNWKPLHIWDCCTGATSTPTITGTYSIGEKGYSFGEDHGYSCYYWSQISGGYLFHSQLYYPYSNKIQDASMGVRCSLGCVRLHRVNAHWIWANVPRGTTVALIH